MQNAIVPSGKAELVNLPGLLDSTIERFIVSLDVKQTTKETYRKSLRAFQIWINANGYARPTKENILEYKESLKNKSALTATLYVAAVRRFFAYLESAGIYPNVAKDIKGMKRPKGFLKENLTADEAGRLLDGIKLDGTRALRDYALINLMMRTGLRTIEIARAKIEDIGREGGESILRVWGKGRDSKDDFVILTNETVGPIQDYLKARGETKLSDPLFASHSDRSNKAPLSVRAIRWIVTGRLQDVGLKTEKVTAHSLRHTTAAIALANGADLLSVRDMMRHSNVNTTLIYAHNLNRITKGAEKFVHIGSKRDPSATVQ